MRDLSRNFMPSQGYNCSRHFPNREATQQTPVNLAGFRTPNSMGLEDLWRKPGCYSRCRSPPARAKWMHVQKCVRVCPHATSNCKKSCLFWDSTSSEWSWYSILLYSDSVSFHVSISMSIRKPTKRTLPLPPERRCLEGRSAGGALRPAADGHGGC